MTIRSEGLFGVGLFLMGATIAASSFAAIAVLAVLPILLMTEFASLGDMAVSIMAIVASKQYGKKSLICTSVFAGVNTLLRVALLTLLLFHLFGTTKSFPTLNGTNLGFSSQYSSDLTTGESDLRTNQAMTSGAKASSSPLETGSPFVAWSISMWALGLNAAIFVLSIVHTRRVMLQDNTTIRTSATTRTSTTTVNGKVYSELSSKV